MVPPLNACGGSKPVKDRLAPKHHVNSVCRVIYISSDLSTSREKSQKYKTETAFELTEYHLNSSNQVNASHGKMLLVEVSQLVPVHLSCVLWGFRMVSTWCRKGTGWTGRPKWNLSEDQRKADADYSLLWYLWRMIYMLDGLMWCDSTLLLINVIDVLWWHVAMSSKMSRLHTQHTRTTERKW